MCKFWSFVEDAANIDSGAPRFDCLEEATVIAWEKILLLYGLCAWFDLHVVPFWPFFEVACRRFLRPNCHKQSHIWS